MAFSLDLAKRSIWIEQTLGRQTLRAHLTLEQAVYARGQLDELIAILQPLATP